MRRDEVIWLLAGARGSLEAFHVKALFIFGSVARDEATAQSDVDLLVDFDETPSLFEFARLRRFLTEILGSPVDLVTRPALRVQLRDRISARPSVPPRDARLRLADMIEAVDRIERYTAGMTFPAFCADQKTVDAVIRNFEVMGEAARHVDEQAALRFRTICRDGFVRARRASMSCGPRDCPIL